MDVAQLLQVAMAPRDEVFEDAVLKTLEAQLQKNSDDTSSFVKNVRRFFAKKTKQQSFSNLWCEQQITTLLSSHLQDQQTTELYFVLTFVVNPPLNTSFLRVRSARWIIMAVFLWPFCEEYTDVLPVQTLAFPRVFQLHLYWTTCKSLQHLQHQINDKTFSCVLYQR